MSSWPDPFDPSLPFHPPNWDPDHFEPKPDGPPHVDPHRIDPNYIDDGGMDISNFDDFTNNIRSLNEEYETVTSANGIPSAIGAGGGARAEALYQESVEVLKLEQRNTMFSIQASHTSYMTEAAKADTFLANKMITQADYDAFMEATKDADVHFSEAYGKLAQLNKLQLQAHEAQYKSFANGMDSLEAQEMEAKFKKANDAFNKVKKTLDANEALARTAGAKEVSLQQELKEAEDALTAAKAAQAAESELMALEDNVAKATTSLEEGTRVAEAARSAWNATKTGLSEAERSVQKVNSIINDRIDYFMEKTAPEGIVPNAANMALGKVKTITNTIQKISEELYGPLKKYSESLTSAGDIMIDGFKTYMDSLIKGETTASEYYLKVLGRSKVLSQPAKDRMKQKVAEIKDLIANGATEEELFEHTAAYASPSFKLYMSTLDELTVLWKGTTLGSGFEMFKVLLLPFKWAIFVVKSAARAITGSVFKLAETVGRAGGQAGFRFMAGLAEAGMATFSVAAEVASKYFSPEVQLGLMLFHMAKDTKHSNNRYQTQERVLHELPFADLYINFDPLKIREYPEFSKQVTSQVPNGDMVNIHGADVAESHVVLDFWASQYIILKNKLGHKYPPYKRWPAFKGIMRVPGLYLPRNKDNLSNVDSVDALAECIRIDDDLELGELVDEGGTISNDDKGQNLILRDFPRHKDDNKYVRNFVDFPLYQNTMHWPDLDVGTAYQIDGQFDENKIDPTIVRLFKLWVTTGTWGTQFNVAKKVHIQKIAMETNKKDLHDFLHPNPNSDYAMIDKQLWVENNKGKRSAMVASMPRVSIEEFDKEYNQPRSFHLEPNMTTTGGVNELYAEFQLLFTDNRKSASNTAIKFFRDHFGRWPMHDDALRYYTDVINGEYWETTKNHLSFDFQMQHWHVNRVKSTRDQIAFFTRLKKQQLDYRAALVKAHGNIEIAYNNEIDKTTWEAYLDDTKGSRTVWGYIQKYRVMLFDELSSVVLAGVGKRKGEIWDEYLKEVSKAHVPLNMNSYARTKFMAKLNMACFDESVNVKEDALGSLKKVTGEFLEDTVVHTGSMSVIDKQSWFKRVMNETIFKLTYDLPVYFGKLLCRIIVLKNPKPTLLIVFKGTTNKMEALVDLDITSTEYCSLLKGEGKDEYGLHVFNEKDSTVKAIKHLWYSDPTAFALHRGFLRAWKSFQPHVVGKVHEFYQKYHIQDVMVTGHSLGAAVAQVCCLEMPGFIRTPDNVLLQGQQGYTRPHYYGFASPNVGDHRYAAVFQEQCSESVQCFTDGDMITALPPFLVPSNESWLSNGAAFMKDLEELGEEGGGTLANMLNVISFAMGKNVANLPPIFQPISWYDGKSSIKSKVLENVGHISDAMNKHGAQRGGGLFIRLDPTKDGKDEQHPYDFGSSSKLVQMIATFANSDDRMKAAKEIHSMRKIVTGLDRMVQSHPDDFSIIDGKLPAWADAKKKDSGKINPFPHHKKDISKAKLIGYAHTTHHYRAYQVVDRSDVDQMQYIHEPVTVGKRTADEIIRRRRHIKMHRTENDYHSY